MQPLLLVLALCAAPILALPRPDYIDDYSDEVVNAWQPEPLKPAPWQAPLPPPRSAPLPPPPPRSAPGPQEAVVPVPGIGQIVGVRGFKNIGGRPVNAFLGLRYGQVGSGLARFQAAQPASLQGRIDATVQSPNCAQFPEVQRLRESESRGENVDDCLTLNIYAPEGARDLPVLVFVHGEMLFDGGAEEAQPDYVLEKDVLLVSINYRLAPFGFLSALSDELPGNVALSDLQLALEWLQRNLVHFGGNPGQVTLAGQAGGATLVHALSLSGRGANLFQQLILQSGTALNPYLIDERPLETLDTFARLARCPPANPGAARSLDPLYECLARLPTSQLVSAFEQLFEQNEPRGLSFLGGFKLVVGDRLGYLPRPPAALAANASNSVPTIIGAAKDASAFILSRFYNQIAGLQSRNVSDYIDVVLRHTAPPSEHRIWKQWALREIFSPDQVYSASARTVSQGLLELSNLILYRAPVIYSIRQSYRSTPVYLYTFDYRGEHHRFGHLDNPLPFGVDASLSDDSVYLFPYPEEASRLNPEDRSLSRALVTMWVNFAVTGVPNPNSGVWPRATSEYGPFLRFTNSRQNMLELDPHFGEGINLPNLYGEYFNATTSSSAAVAPVAPPTRPTYTYPTPSTTTTTTTTTTRRPYAYNPYANWQNRQPQQPQQPWRPANPDYVRAQEERQAQFIREQQERAQREREQRWREQQARDNQNSRPAQDPREQQRLMQERERQHRLQQERERQQREQQEREQQQREEQERERQQREQQEREQQERERQEREQQEREQQEREQQEREQQEREHQARNQNPHDERRPYPSYDEYLQSHPDESPESSPEREQQEREQQEREHQARNENPHDERRPYPSYEEYLQSHPDESPESSPDRGYDEEQERELREQQQREQQQREQEQRLEEERLEQEREQREREQQPDENPEDERQAYPSYEDYLRSQQGENPPDSEPERNYNEEQEREQQQREQQEREQQEREQQEREQQEREREQREREQQQREPQPDRDDPQNYPSYEDYLRAHQAGQPAESDPTAEEQEREQERRDQLDQEREEPVEQDHGDDRSPYPGYDEYERSQEDNGDQEPSDPANDPSSYPSYEDYVRAQQKLREEEEERDRAREAQERAEEEQEESRQEYPGHSQFRGLLRGPQHIKLMHRQQRRRQ